MGQTTRRQPISFNIPAAPDYKFLNITDFAGLNVTDNPFTAKANTASDALNVYVDENNALSTRPRLEKVDELLLKINMPSMILIGVYPIPNGYLIHGHVGSDYLLYSYINNVKEQIIGDNIPKTKCNVFTHNNSIYLLSGSAYMTIKDNKLVEVDGYIPKIKVAKRNDDGSDSYATYESLNLLSDKFKESYFWDGESDNITKDSSVVDIENNYFEKAVFYDKLQDDYEILYYDKTNKTFICKNSNLEVCNIKILDEYKDSEIKLRSFKLYNANKYSMAKNKPYMVIGAADSTKKIVGVYIFDCSGENMLSYTNPNNNDNITTPIIQEPSLFSSFYEVSDFGLSPNGTYLWVRAKVQNYSNYQLFWYAIDYEKKTATSKTVINTELEYDTFENLYFSDDEKYAWATFTSFTTPQIPFSKLGRCTISALQVDIIKIEGTILDGNSGVPSDCAVSSKGDLYMAFRNVIEKIVRSDSSTKRLSFNFNPKNIQLDEVNDRLFFTYDDSHREIFPTGIIQNIGVALKVSEFKEFYLLGIKFQDAKDLFLYNSPEYIITQNTNGIGFYLYKTSIEPLVIVTKRLTSANDEYEKWLERRENFLKAFLTVRFDNNMWFASNNALYRSLYNDPTYVSSASYTTLGDGLSEITGFNIAGDELLVAYKKDRLYLIQPHTYTVSGLDYYDYVYTETKNTVGNEAYGNTIVTVLTEVPLQITKDGIFALNQLKNVQSSERISRLISQNINKKWLNENNEAIINCQTINRLYWTYFILNDIDNKLTKIYLLDNRTSSWYYWELPIVTLKAYVKDNKTNFIDVDGNVYELKTNDTFNPYNPEETEYYDDGRQLIKWYWQSQILPLGTINYSKRLVNTTFIVSDTDESDEYGLNYAFKIYRKLVSESNTTTVSNNLNYVQSVTKKTMIPRFNFLQIKLSNIEEEDNEAFNNNKFRLIGLGLKYVLLEGLY